MKSREDLFIEQINEKREEAYHELFKEFYRSLVLFAMRYIEEQEEAEDIIQELFVAVWEKKEKFLSYNSFCVFLYRSVRNTCLNRIRHRKIEERYRDYTICHKEDTEDDFEMIEEELYRRLFKVIDELASPLPGSFFTSFRGKRKRRNCSSASDYSPDSENPEKTGYALYSGTVGCFRNVLVCRYFIIPGLFVS